ncbi:APC family permease [Sphingomonas sp. RB56-2]|uniref:APC family permease n=1 Tax=Sphingomonas brevis TaxID=2908206 RepID=A0ABT0S9J0_9SPHN|nr:APC family permease [Sphingomonas brevis]MCL6740998.1 APC family permease [Sphingomonas brevis]
MGSQAQQPAEKGSALHRVLGLAFGLAIGFGGVVGGGLLKTSGSVAALTPEPWLIVALWAACSLHSFLGANVVAEVMTALPRDGGLFVTARRAFGDFGGLVVGWADAAQTCAAIAAVTILFATFAGMIVPALIPYGVALAIGVQVLLLGVNLLGIREGSAVQQATALLKAIMLAAIVMTLLMAAGTGAMKAPAPGAMNLVGAITAYLLIYGVYSGWAYPGYFGDESKSGGREIPKAIFGSIAAASFVYIGFNLGLVAALDIPTLAHSDFPAAEVVGRVIGADGRLILVAIAMLVVFSSANAYILIAPRIIYGLGRDGLFFKWSAHVNRGGTPDWSTILAVAASIAMTMSGSFETVFLLMGAMTLFTFVVTDIAYFVLRHREPDLERPYRARGHPYLPILLLAIDGTLFAAYLWSDPVGGMAMLAMIAIAIPISGLIHFQKRRKQATA